MAEGTAALAVKACAERQEEFQQNNNYQDESAALTDYNAKSPPRQSFLRTIHHLVDPRLILGNTQTAMASMEQTVHAGKTWAYAGPAMNFWMGLGMILQTVQVVLAMIPSFRNDSANDPVFFALGGSLLVVIINWFIVANYLQCTQTSRTGCGEDGWQYDFGCAWFILDDGQECSEASLGAGKKIGNDRVMRWFMINRLLVHW